MWNPINRTGYLHPQEIMEPSMILMIKTSIQSGFENMVTLSIAKDNSKTGGIRHHSARYLSGVSNKGVLMILMGDLSFLKLSTSQRI